MPIDVRAITDDLAASEWSTDEFKYRYRWSASCGVLITMIAVTASHRGAGVIIDRMGRIANVPPRKLQQSFQNRIEAAGVLPQPAWTPPEFSKPREWAIPGNGNLPWPFPA